jgi:hypothetical protein
MLITSTTGATNINDAHEAVGGVFDVDPDTAAHLLLFPGWRHATPDEARAFTGTPDESPAESDTEDEVPGEDEVPAAKRTRKPRAPKAPDEPPAE